MEQYNKEAQEVYYLTNPYIPEEYKYKPLKRGHYVSVRTEPKTGRNEPCTCGSGKKYKKYCALAN